MNPYEEIYTIGSNDFSPEFLMGMVGVILIVLAIALVFSLVFYIFQSLAMYTIAKRRGIKNPGLAWVPVANYWIMGCISDQYRYVAKREVKNRRSIMLAFMIASFVISTGSSMFADPDSGIYGLVAVLQAGIGLATSILWLMCLSDLYTSCNPDSSVLFLVLSIILSFTAPFLMFACRNKDLGMPPRRDAAQNTAAETDPQWDFAPRKVEWENSNDYADGNPEWQPTQGQKEPWEDIEE